MITATAPARMTTLMSIDPKLITLTQWLSPASPVGAFAYSHGLESAIAQGWVQSGDDLHDWLHDLLSCGSGRSDAGFLIRATREAHAPLDIEARAFAASAERLHEATRQGAAFARVANPVWGLALPDLMFPVALGCAVRAVGIDAEAAAALYLHSFAGNLVSAAQRLMPLGQTEAQAVLHRLTPLCTDIAADLAQDPTAWSISWASDIAAMRHETLDSRLFQS